MLADRRAAGHDLGVAADQALGVLAGDHLHQIRVAVQVVEVLQQREVQRVPDMRRLHALRQVRRQIDSQLLIADGVREDAFGDRLEVGKALLLLLLGAPRHGQLAPQALIRAVARHLVGELHGLVFRAVHQDDAAFGVGVDLQRMIRPGIEVVEARERVDEGDGLLVKGIHDITLLTHSLSMGMCGYAAQPVKNRTRTVN